MKVRVRQPLRTLQAFIPVRDVSEELISVLKEELNVKEVQFLQRSEELVALRAQPNFRVLGKRFGGRTQEAATRVKELVSDALRGFREGSPLRIEVGGEVHELLPEEVDVREEPKGDLVVESDAGYTIALDPEIDEALRHEGLAREIVNRVQRLRKDSGLDVSDRIKLRVAADGEVFSAAQSHRDYIASETLARDIEVMPLETGDGATVDLDGHNVKLSLDRVE
jgi:isoleucyl-tRNA synthetase